MTVAQSAIGSRTAMQRERSAPPVRLWLAVLGMIAPVLAALAVAPLFMATPLPLDADNGFYGVQLGKLDKQARALSARGAKPLTIVFIGTSRMKNVAFRADEVASSARQAGVTRPVASTFIGINWSGFERLGPAIQQLEHHQIDVIVIMPDLLFEDLNYSTRVRLFFRYIQSKLWGQQYNLFGDREYYLTTCFGFDHPVAERIALSRQWITDGEQLPGPRMARNAVRDLNDRGKLVVIADVPVTRTMMEKRGALPDAHHVAQSFNGLPNVRIAEMPDPFPQSDYCDWAHIDPAHASVWQRAFFGRMAVDLNRLH